MLTLVLAAVSIGVSPPDPHKAAREAIRKHDYRIAGVTSFWGSARLQRPDWRPYGLKCNPLPDNAYAFGYFVSDAIGKEAFEGYKKQRHFLVTYNAALLASGKLPADWGCVSDPNPGPL